MKNVSVYKFVRLNVTLCVKHSAPDVIRSAQKQFDCKRWMMDVQPLNKVNE